MTRSAPRQERAIRSTRMPVSLLSSRVALRVKGEQHFGDSQADIRAELLGYSKANAYVAEHFADARCTCGAHVFGLSLDDTEGAAVRTCSECDQEHAIGDSGDYLDEAELEDCECPCGGTDFEVTVAVALYKGSDDVKWLYLGCRCIAWVIRGCWG